MIVMARIFILLNLSQSDINQSIDEKLFRDCIDHNKTAQCMIVNIQTLDDIIPKHVKCSLVNISSIQN